MSRISQGSENDCIVCFERLSTCRYTCGHVLLCNQCHARNLDQRCPKCRAAIVDQPGDATALQPAPLTVRDVDITEDIIPFGVSQCGGAAEYNDPAAVRKVSAWVEEVRAGTMTYTELSVRMGRELTRAEEELVQIELAKNQDLYTVLRKVDEQKYGDMYRLREINRTFNKMIKDHGKQAIELRAGLGAVGGVVVTAGATVVAGGTNAVNGASAFPALSTIQYASEVVISSLVFCVFTGIEIYRWSNGRISGENCLRNIGEHAVGTCSGVASAVGGIKSGAVIGTCVGGPVGMIVGTAIGALLGVCFGWLGNRVSREAYRKVLPPIPETYEEVHHVQERLSPKEIAQRSADKLGISLDWHSFKHAKEIYREKLLASHPDKHAGQSEDVIAQQNQEMIDILACWNIVREYYKDNNNDEVDAMSNDEAYVRLYVMKVYNAVDQTWRSVRAWFGERSNTPEDTEHQKVERITFYM